MKDNALSTSGEQCGAHSGKSTTLSWCGKAHVPRGTIRALGYHVPLKDKMVKVYSRDYQAGPLRKLEEVEAKIDSGEFDPDVTRSGRFKTKLHDKAPYIFCLHLVDAIQEAPLAKWQQRPQPLWKSHGLQPGLRSLRVSAAERQDLVQALLRG